MADFHKTIYSDRETNRVWHELYTKIITHIPNKFWKDVLLSFRHLNKQMILNDDDVLKSPLFYNENIKIDGTSIFFKPWFNKGVKYIYINDLVDDKGDFYTQADFSRKTGIKTNFLQYNGLIKAIKQYLKHIKIDISFKAPTPFIPSTIRHILRHGKGSNDMYQILNKNNDIPTGKITWNKIYHIEESEWKAIYTFPYRVTSYPALRWFQISINNNVLVTNKLLQQMRIKNDGLCTFCQSSNESIIHLFWQCQMTQNFIKSVVAWLSTYDIDCHISEKYFILGWQKEQSYSKVLNFIILYAKYYIYITRCKEAQAGKDQEKAQSEKDSHSKNRGGSNLYLYLFSSTNLNLCLKCTNK